MYRDQRRNKENDKNDANSVVEVYKKKNDQLEERRRPLKNQKDNLPDARTKLNSLEFDYEEKKTARETETESKRK
jgi:hypothetical protein